MKRKKIFIFVIIIIAILIASGVYIVNSEIYDNYKLKKAYKNAVSLYETGNYEEALTIFTEMGESYGVAKTYILKCKYEIAAGYLERGNLQVAMKRLKEIEKEIDVFDLVEQCNSRLGRQAFRKKEYDKAFSYFMKMSNLKTVEEDIYEIGQIYFEREDFDQALQVLDSISYNKKAAELLSRCQLKKKYQYAYSYNSITGRKNDAAYIEKELLQYYGTYYVYGTDEEIVFDKLEIKRRKYAVKTFDDTYAVKEVEIYYLDNPNQIYKIELYSPYHARQLDIREMYFENSNGTYMDMYTLKTNEINEFQRVDYY